MWQEITNKFAILDPNDLPIELC